MAKKKDFIAPPPSDSQVPTSKFDLSHINHLTMKFGQAYPCLLVDAPAKSTYNIKPSVGLDFMPFRVPVQSSIRAHMSFYKIPKRILFKNFPAWKTGYGNYVLPYLKRSYNFHQTGSLADYMGIPSYRVQDVDDYASQPLSPCKGYDIDGYQIAGADNHQLFFSSSKSYFCRYFTMGHPLSTDLRYSHNIEILTAEPISGSMHNLILDSYLIERYQNAYSREHNNFLRRDSLEYVSNSASLVAGKWCIPLETRSVQKIVNGVTVYSTIIQFIPTQTFVETVNSRYLIGREIRIVIAWDSRDSIFGDGHNDLITNKYPLTGESVVVEGEGDNVKFVNKIELKGYGIVSLDLYSRVTHFQSPDTDSPFVSQNGNDPVIPISALPFRAYEFIGNYFFRNLEIDPFLVDGVEPFDEYITTDEAGADTKTPLDFFHVPYEFDMFTTCLKTPSFGQSPLVPLRGREGEDGQFAAVHMTKDDGTTYEIKLQYDAQDGTITGVTATDGYEETDAVIMLKEATNYGISVNDFRNVSALQKFQDRMQRVVNGHGSKYFNFVKEFYGTNAPIGEDFPEYLGGHTETMNVSKLMNTGEQDNLGDFCGVGSVRGKGRNIRCFCSEDCYIMGIIYLTCAPVYSQQLPRLFTKTSAMEFANPAFNNITPQPVYKHQIAPLQLASGHEHDVFGFNVPFVEYRQMLDECHGNFRTQSMHDYLAQRIFGSAPVLGKDFIYQDNEDIVEIFKSQQDDDKVIGLIHFDMKGCKLPFPQYMVPKII